MTAYDDDAFGHWLAGFIDGEGCFDISRSRSGGFACRFVLEVRHDDAAILREACEVVGAGSIWEYDRGAKGRSVRWSVSSKADCQTLVAYLDRYYLRAKKARDYAIWREAVHDRAVAPRTRVRHDWSRMARLKQMLVDGRRPAPVEV